MKQKMTISMFQEACRNLARQISEDKNVLFLFPIPQGGVPVAMRLQKELHLLGQTLVEIVDEDWYTANCLSKQNYLVVVDDIVDSGRTMEKYSAKGLFTTAAIHLQANSAFTPSYYVEKIASDIWIEYWWEKKGTDIESHIVRQLEYIGEDPNREGLLETPKRIVKSWDKLYGGYKIDPKSVFKSFADGACDSMVVLKDIEFFSTCEHHMLPFSGKAHIAYIPNGRVLGISKLARLLEIYSRRMQIQERIGEQIVDAIMENLGAKGAICVLEAQHHCMTARGVEKQKSIMITSSLRGVFEEISVRNEFLTLVK